MAACKKDAANAFNRDTELATLRRAALHPHPHVANLIDVLNGPLYTHGVLEYCSGGSLLRHLQRLQTSSGGHQSKLLRGAHAPPALSSRRGRAALAAPITAPISEKLQEVAEPAARALAASYEAAELATSRTAYVRTSATSGPALVLVHGFDSSAMEFRRLLPELERVEGVWFGSAERLLRAPRD